MYDHRVPTLEEAIATVRVARGFSQEELAKELGVSQAVYSKGESGVAPFTADRVDRIAEILNVPSDYFTRTTAGVEARVFHRKRASLPVKTDRRIRAEAAVLQSQLSALLGDRRPPLNLPQLAPTDDGALDPRDIAGEVRRAWNIGPGPINNLVDIVERAGIMVLAHDMNALRIDAIATWPPTGSPVIFLATHAPADRQRFTLAHEIGHAVMHHRPRDEQEREADEFASEFLMPAADIIDELQKPTLATLVGLKEKWGVSMQALARRARDLGAMTERQYKSFSIEMSSTGMRSNEPGFVSVEHPKLIQQTVDTRLASGEDQTHIAHSAQMTHHDFAARFLEGQS